MLNENQYPEELSRHIIKVALEKFTQVLAEQTSHEMTPKRE